MVLKETLTREREEIKDEVQKELDDKIYEVTDDPPKLELGDALANIFGPEAEDTLDEKFVNKKELEDEALENIKEEYSSEEIKMPLMKLLFLINLIFSMVAAMKTLFKHITFCHLVITKGKLLLFLYLMLVKI